MASGITPEEVRSTEFRTAIRGFDRAQVEAFLDGLASQIADLDAERERLATQLGESGDRDLESEFESIGREVTGILRAAREAADSMRERASLDAARWRSEAMAEAEENRRSAVADAEAMRRDAWATGTELLEQASAQAQREREQAERDVLTVMGEAEREAHRLTSGARREAEDVLRGATMDAEKTTSEAAKRRDDIIDVANRQAAAAQERTRALEQRRNELLEELENVRSTLTRLEGSLEEKRESLDLSAAGSTSVRVVPSRPTAAEETAEPKTWEPGETVRVVRAEPRPRYEEPPVELEIEEPASQELTEPGGPAEETEIEEVGAEAPVLERDHEPEAESEPDTSSAQTYEVPEDEVEALFAALRVGGHVEEAPPSAATETPAEPEPIAPEVQRLHPEDTRDWIEERDARLLPITNRALRGTKRAIAELQNIALDGLRTDEAWRPDAAAIVNAVQADLIAVWAESFAAGHGVAEEMTGSKLKRPATPQTEGVDDFATHLADAVSGALDDASDGQRERQSAASRVFRVWRTDESERRIRELAIHAYEQAVELSVGASTG